MPLQWMNHTGFVVSDMERSLAFYRDTLGLEVQRDIVAEGPDISNIVGFPDARLRIVYVGPSDMRHAAELIQYLHPVPEGRVSPTRRNDIGATHLGVIVDDLQALYEELTSKGVVFVNPPMLREARYPRGIRTCYLEDPDGNWLEFIEREPPPPDARIP